MRLCMSSPRSCWGQGSFFPGKGNHPYRPSFIFERATAFSFWKGHYPSSIGKSSSPWEAFDRAPRPRPGATHRPLSVGPPCNYRPVLYCMCKTSYEHFKWHQGNGEGIASVKIWPGDCPHEASGLKSQAWHLIFEGKAILIFKGKAIFILQRALPLENLKRLSETFEGGTKAKTGATEDLRVLYSRPEIHTVIYTEYLMRLHPYNVHVRI